MHANQRRHPPEGPLWSCGGGSGRIRAFTEATLVKLWATWCADKTLQQQRYGQFVWNRLGYDGSWCALFYAEDEAYKLLYELMNKEKENEQRAQESGYQRPEAVDQTELRADEARRWR